MKRILVIMFAVLLAGCQGSEEPKSVAIRGNTQAEAYTESAQFLKVGYLPSWCLNTTGMPTIPPNSGANPGNYGNLPYNAIDFTALTHIVVFACNFNADGTIPATNGNLVWTRQKPFNDYVKQQAGIPVLLSFGGSTGGGFPIGTAALRTTAARNLIRKCLTEGYGGWDCDMEPVNAADTLNLRRFLMETAESCRANGLIQTVAGYNFPTFWARISGSYDWIHHMTYDFQGTWNGKGWHNNAIYTEAGNYQAGTTVLLNSVKVKADQWLAAGIPKSKYLPGLDLNGYAWRGGQDASGNGIIAPRQVWRTAPTKVNSNELRGWQIYRDYILPYAQYVRFDSIAKVPYIGVDNPGYADDLFVIFQDLTTVNEFVRLVKTEGYAGGFIWELGGGYYGTSDFSSWQGPRDPYLQNWKYAWGADPVDTIPPPPPVNACSLLVKAAYDSGLGAGWNNGLAAGYRQGWNACLDSVPQSVTVPKPVRR